MNRVYVNARNGLGNKLRVIGSAVCFQRHLKRETGSDWQLLVVWHPDEHCRAEYGDLYESAPFPVLRDVPSLPENALRLPRKNCPLDRENLASAVRAVRGLENVALYLETASVLPCGDDWTESARAIRSLPVRTELLAKVDALWQARIGVGLHVRTGQAAQSFDSTVGWSPKAVEAWERARRASSCDRFLRLVESLPRDTVFYLASDNPEVYEIFSKRFPGRVVYQKRDLFDRSAEQMRTALVDALLLARCPAVYGSGWSSFTELVARLGGPSAKEAGRDF